MIEFNASDLQLTLIYTPELGRDNFLKRLYGDDGVVIRKTFHFTRDDVMPDPDGEQAESFAFDFGSSTPSGTYYRIPGVRLGADFDLYWSTDLPIGLNCFIAVRDISIMKKLINLSAKEIRIGTQGDSNLSPTTFRKLLKTFPTTWEMNRYADMRIGSVVREELDLETDHSRIYEDYRIKVASRPRVTDSLALRRSEHDKYAYLLQKLSAMLNDLSAYDEKTWQHELVPVLEVLFPKYVAVLEEITIRDVIANKRRRLDYLFVDADGNCDIAEIKKPELRPLLTPNLHRKNHVPRSELAGTVMQVEKYLYFLNKWGRAGEIVLSKRYAAKLPDSVSIQLTSPRGFILMGLDRTFTAQQKIDFEVIRRQYRNIAEILTYDDLLRRLELLVDKFAPKAADSDGQHNG